MDQKGERMRKPIFWVTLLFLAATASAYAYDNGDFQVWNTDVEEYSIDKASKIALEEEFRWGNDSREFFYQHYDLGYTRQLKKWLSLGGGYRQVLSLQKNKWLVENEPYITATLFWELKGFKLDSRNRLEYRHFDYQSDMGRYRNKFTLKFPWKITKLEIQPFLSDEVMFRFGGTNQFSENRAYSGVMFGFGKNLKAEIYYMFNSVKSTTQGKWNGANVLGTKVKAAF